MKLKTLKALFIFILFSCNVTSQDVLSPEAFEEGMKKDSAHQLLDVRTPEEYDDRHLANAINYNINDESFAKNLNQLDKHKPVYVYCLSGRRSSNAQKILLENGFTKVYNLEGGIKNWELQSKPVEHKVILKP